MHAVTLSERSVDLCRVYPRNRPAIEDVVVSLGVFIESWIQRPTTRRPMPDQQAIAPMSQVANQHGGTMFVVLLRGIVDLVAVRECVVRAPEDYHCRVFENLLLEAEVGLEVGVVRADAAHVP